jgi:hypothetical protein
MDIIWVIECRRDNYYDPRPAVANLRWKAEGTPRESGVAICKGRDFVRMFNRDSCAL